MSASELLTSQFQLWSVQVWSTYLNVHDRHSVLLSVQNVKSPGHDLVSGEYTIWVVPSPLGRLDWLRLYICSLQTGSGRLVNRQGLSFEHFLCNFDRGRFRRRLSRCD